MLEGKMLAGILADDLMLRIAPELVPDLVEQPGGRMMEMGGRPMNGYILIDETAHRNPQGFQRWMQLAMDFNPRAKSSRRK